MEQSDFLTTSAQIAVGLAGFTGVASVFGRQPSAVTVRRGFKVLRNVGLEADRSWRAIVGALGTMTFGSLFAGVVGLRASTFYLLALLLQLVLCALFFYRFFVSMHTR